MFKKLAQRFADWLNSTEGYKMDVAERNWEARAQKLTPLRQKCRETLSNRQKPFVEDMEAIEKASERLVEILSHAPVPPCKPPRSETINRIEVIDSSGRIFTHTYSYLNEQRPEVHYQDDGKTLKIFLKEK